MSTYEVRFIREASDPEKEHLVVEVRASNHDEALQKAREIKKEDWIAGYQFWSVEVKRF